MDQLILWGASGQARVLRELLSDREMKIVALFDNDPKALNPFTDVPLHGGWDAFLRWREKQAQAAAIHFLVAIGGDRGKDRVEIQERLEAAGLVPATAIHRTAFVATDALLGAGCQILAQSAVCAQAQLGAGCIVNTSASVDHECRLADGVHVAPGARLAGCVEVGAYSMIGMGAVVLPRTRVGSNSVVGAGAVVIRDVPDNVVVAGNPAVKIGDRSSP